MAEGRDPVEQKRRFTDGSASMLLNAITDFENRRRGRAGMTLPHFSVPNSNDNRNRQEVGHPHGRVQVLEMLVPGLGGLSSWRGRGRGLSPPTPQSTPPRPVGGKRQRLPSSIPTNTSTTLRRSQTPVRHHETPLRQPQTMALCLCPMGISHPISLYHTGSQCPPHHDDLFPHQYATLCILQWQWHACPHHP